MHSGVPDMESIWVHLTTSFIATLDNHPQYHCQPLKSSLLKHRWHPSNFMYLYHMQLLAQFFLLCYCTYFYIYWLYTLSHILQLSIFITANGTDAKRGEESLFTEGLKSTSWDSTYIQENSQSSFPMRCLPSNSLPWYIVLQMTTIPEEINEAA
jgi:hypothetical protein